MIIIHKHITTHRKCTNRIRWTTLCNNIPITGLNYVHFRKAANFVLSSGNDHYQFHSEKHNWQDMLFTHLKPETDHRTCMKNDNFKYLVSTYW